MKNISQTTNEPGIHKKMISQWQELHRVMEILGDVTVKIHPLEKPYTSTKAEVIKVQRLKVLVWVPALSCLEPLRKLNSN